MLKEIGENIWTMNGPNVVFAGASMHTRMTIVRLANNHLWIHSPIKYTPDAKAAISSLGGQVVALIAPNKYHHMFVQEWQEEHPTAEIFAEANLRVRIEHLQAANELTNEAPKVYRDEIDQLIFGGNRLFQEVVFFHMHSETLILTDLMINLRPEEMSFLPRLFLKFEGALYPNGGVPTLFRWFTSNKGKAREALAVIRQWAPKQVTFCHGEPFGLTAGKLIAKEFRWLDP